MNTENIDEQLFKDFETAVKRDDERDEKKDLVIEKQEAKVIPLPSAVPEWELLQRQCRAFVFSGLLPEHITKGVDLNKAVARAITIAAKGKELGLPPMQSFSSITVIQGKPCLSAELMLALIYKKMPKAKISFKTPPDKADKECVIEMQRPEHEVQVFRFTMEDANRAGLSGKDPWKKYPSAMLRARAISIGARAVFPDVVMGCYTPEELGVGESEE